MKYCENILAYQRRKTRQVMVGDVGVGGVNPIRVQSMTIADTMDTAATIREIQGLVAVGCEIVRITAPSIREAENLKQIQSGLNAVGIRIPLVADIHFTPNAALIAAEHVDKVRINPGNYADKKRFEQHDYTDAEYALELERLHDRFAPLVQKCQKLGRSMRIGTNHGSLSDRVMNRYGDTAEGMVESALEFVRICQHHSYHDLILSMKSSNPIVAIQAYRLLAARMLELGMDYPFHLGVTEAGDGAEGRIKSAIGIGALLDDGIGDTIRVSLTEDAVAEVPVAFRLVEKYNKRSLNGRSEAVRLSGVAGIVPANPFDYSRRQTLSAKHLSFALGGTEVPRVEMPLSSPTSDIADCVREIKLMLGQNPETALHPLPSGSNAGEVRCDLVHVTVATSEDIRHLNKLGDEMVKQGLNVGLAMNVTNFSSDIPVVARNIDRLVCRVSCRTETSVVATAVGLACLLDKPVEWVVVLEGESGGSAGFEMLDAVLDKILDVCTEFDRWNILFSLQGENCGNALVHQHRYLAGRLDKLGVTLPIVLRFDCDDSDAERLTLDASAQLGSLLCDGIGDSILLHCSLPIREQLQLGYDILQATRLRISKTDYISCPSCGRTLFDLQLTTRRIKSITSHLKGLKIAIMGCIVNGPGEMADADFGYVGAGPGLINLFVGKECVERNIPESDADQRLIALIKKHNKWTETSVV